MSFDDAMGLADTMDLPDGAYWAMAHELSGLEYGEGFPELIGGGAGHVHQEPKPPKKPKCIRMSPAEPGEPGQDKPWICRMCGVRKHKKRFATLDAAMEHFVTKHRDPDRERTRVQQLKKGTA